MTHTVRLPLVVVEVWTNLNNELHKLSEKEREVLKETVYSVFERAFSESQETLHELYPSLGNDLDIQCRLEKMK